MASGMCVLRPPALSQVNARHHGQHQARATNGVQDDQVACGPLLHDGRASDSEQEHPRTPTQNRPTVFADPMARSYVHG